MRLCVSHHRYFLGDQELVSVSKVIRTVLPTDYSGIMPEVLEHARGRGERVDRYFCEYLRTGTLTIAPGEWADVVSRLSLLIRWFDKSGMTVESIQETVHSKQDGVAGTMDLRAGGVVDVKVVSELQPSYALQLGAYAEYGQEDGAGIIHVTAKDCRFVPYDVNQCKAWWRQAVEWFRTMQEIKVYPRPS